MQYFVKLVHIHDGDQTEHHDGDRMTIESYPRAEKIIAAFLSDGWQLKDRTQRITPNIVENGSCGFFLGGWDCLFVKEARDGETDNGDDILEKALHSALDDDDDIDDDDDDDGDDDFLHGADDSGSGGVLPVEVIPDELRALAEELGIDPASLLAPDGETPAGGSDDGDSGDGDSDSGDSPDDDLIAQMNRLLNM